MKSLFKILAPSFIAISLVSCMTAATSDNYGYNDSYNQGYSQGYVDGYYRSPDGNYYAPNSVYSDYNGNYYRNGSVYRQGVSRNQNNNSGRTGNMRSSSMPTLSNSQSGSRNETNVRVQFSSGMRTQSQNTNRVQQQSTRSSQSSIRVQPQIEQSSNTSGQRGMR